MFKPLSGKSASSTVIDEASIGTDVVEVVVVVEVVEVEPVEVVVVAPVEEEDVVAMEEDVVDELVVDDLGRETK